MKSIRERFFDKVEKTDSCWNWTASLNFDGYGRFLLNGKSKGAHRISWELHNGLISSNLCVLHTCDNRKCVNPKHLFLGTHQDNIQDRSQKKRTYRHLGENNGKAFLNQKIVLKIRKIYSLGNITQTQLAKKFNLSVTHIFKIVNKQIWKHI